MEVEKRVKAVVLKWIPEGYLLTGIIIKVVATKGDLE